jgi:hypothetical protein
VSLVSYLFHSAYSTALRAFIFSFSLSNSVTVKLLFPSIGFKIAFVLYAAEVIVPEVSEAEAFN